MKTAIERSWWNKAGSENEPTIDGFTYTGIVSAVNYSIEHGHTANVRYYAKVLLRFTVAI